jgi:hypothetical protein
MSRVSGIALLAEMVANSKLLPVLCVSARVESRERRPGFITIYSFSDGNAEPGQNVPQLYIAAIVNVIVSLVGTTEFWLRRGKTTAATILTNTRILYV